MKANRLLLLVGTARCAVRAWTQRLIANRRHRGASSRPKPARREIFVLTPEEKKTIYFVLVAFVLGLATKHYRDNHSRPPPKAEISADGKVSPRPSSRQTRVLKQPPTKRDPR
jgi:hypothetical protein